MKGFESSCIYKIQPSGLTRKNTNVGAVPSFKKLLANVPETHVAA